MSHRIHALYACVRFIICY